MQSAVVCWHNCSRLWIPALCWLDETHQVHEIKKAQFELGKSVDYRMLRSRKYRQPTAYTSLLQKLKARLAVEKIKELVSCDYYLNNFLHYTGKASPVALSSSANVEHSIAWRDVSKA